MDDSNPPAAVAAPVVLNPLSLTGAQRRTLRGLGHHLRALVQIGKDGVTAGLVLATCEVLEDHELIKISVNTEAPLNRKEAPQLLATAVGAHVAQVIGRTALLYRRRFDEPIIELPGVVMEAPQPAKPKPKPKAKSKAKSAEPKATRAKGRSR
ncbi:MAG: RNA-binding protein [Bradymonadia bacterium]|jgi:RNA-binding protein